MKIKGAIFDMDGTLVDSLMFWSVLWKKIGKKYFGEEDFVPNAEVDRQARTMIFVEALAHIWKHYGLACSCEEFVEFGTHGIHEFYREYAKPKAGAIALLDYLKQNGAKICLATATDPEYIPNALDCCGMTGYFDEILSCVTVGRGKDRPSIYLTALERLNCFPDEACVFEDSFVALETAKRIGCHTVGVFDRFNHGQDRLLAASEIYLDQTKGLDAVIPQLTIEA